MTGAIHSVNDQDVTFSNHLLFWLILVVGEISGIAKYFILRFTHILPWYFVYIAEFGIQDIIDSIVSNQ
jgi:hypothetical protein